MFTWLNKQGVRSDQGFEFQFTGRFTAEYREGGRVADMYVESGGGIVTVYEGSLEKLWNDIANTVEKKAERDRVITNVREALAFQGLKMDLAAGAEPDY